MIKVFVNGTFDVLHIGHLDLLNAAKAYGNYLLVALDTDERIKDKKGKDRPFNNQINRVALMSNLKSVDRVEVFGSDDELKAIIKNYSPDIMIVGSDWEGKPIIGSEYAKEIRYYKRENDESSTKTIQSYINRR